MKYDLVASSWLLWGPALVSGNVYSTHNLVECCFTPLSTVFQSCQTFHIIRVFPGFHQYYAGALKCLAQGHSHEKPQRIQCGANPGPLDYESNTLPLSHAGPQTHNLEALGSRFTGCPPGFSL